MKTVEEKAKEYTEGCFDGLSDFIKDEDILMWYKELILTCIIDFHKEEVSKLMDDLDFALARIEDYAKGEVGNDITNLRKIISDKSKDYG